MSDRIRARKSLGQNFLVDANIQRRIVDAIDPQPHDTIIEIGPGQAALTEHLVQSSARIIGVELDDRLADNLQRRFAAADNFKIVRGDALKWQPTDDGVDIKSAKLIGNIPYNITTPLLFHFLQPEMRPHTLVLMIQKEVADRILAEPGGKEYGALSIGVRTVATVEKLFTVGRGAFRPVPGVDSCVIRVTPHQPAPLAPDEERDLRELTRICFSWRRKQLQKILRASPEYGLDAEQLGQVESSTGIDLNARPETLSPDAFITLSRALRSISHASR